MKPLLLLAMLVSLVSACSTMPDRLSPGDYVTKHCETLMMYAAYEPEGEHQSYTADRARELLGEMADRLEQLQPPEVYERFNDATLEKYRAVARAMDEDATSDDQDADDVTYSEENWRRIDLAEGAVVEAIETMPKPLADQLWSCDRTNA